MRDVLVLCYHGISEAWPEPTAVRPGVFEDQLQALLRQGYRGATLSAALTDPPAERTLAVTFDDACRSVLELAAPIMARLGLPGTVYVPTDYAAGERPMGWEGFGNWLGTPHEPELRCLSWEQLATLVGDGWEVGSHTRSHRRLSQLDEAAIAAELSESKGAIEERLGRRCESLAYPYSDYDARAVRAAWEAGYRSAVTTPTVPVSPLPLEWPRVVITRGDSTRRLLLRVRSRRLVTPPLTQAALALRRLTH